MYDGLYDENHRFLKFNPKDHFEKDDRIYKLPKGEYESGILCKECDNNIIGKLETYGNLAIYGKGIQNSRAPTIETFRTQSGTLFARASNLDYNQFKLFHLSILWRASISKRDFFKEVNLGPHEEIIGKMILENDPRSATDYPIVFSSFTDGKYLPKALITQPKKARSKEGIRVYIFVISGMIYHFFVGQSSEMPDYIVDETITEDGTATITSIPRGKGWEYIMKYYGLSK